jgi:hypothetical protein
MMMKLIFFSQLTEKHLKPNIPSSLSKLIRSTENINTNPGKIKTLLLIVPNCKASNGQRAKREAMVEHG